MSESKFAVEVKLCRGVLPLLTIIVEHTLGLIVRNVDSLQSAENGCHGLLIDLIYIATLVMLEQLFKLLNYIILVTDGLVETFDVTFLMFRHLVGVGILLSDLETPGIVTQWIVAGE